MPTFIDRLWVIKDVLAIAHRHTHNIKQKTKKEINEWCATVDEFIVYEYVS